MKNVSARQMICKIEHSTPPPGHMDSGSRVILFGNMATLEAYGEGQQRDQYDDRSYWRRRPTDVRMPDRPIA